VSIYIVLQYRGKEGLAGKSVLSAEEDFVEVGGILHDSQAFPEKSRKTHTCFTF